MTQRRFELPRLFWISPGAGLSSALERRLAACVGGGLRAFQLREKASFPRDIVAALARLRRSLPAASGQLLVVNDRVDVALVADCDGVHLTSASIATADARRLLGTRAWIGRSVHNEAELEEAVDGGADYVFVSPVYPVSKRGRPPAPPLGLRGLKAFVEQSPLPVYALGGIREARLDELFQTGIHGVAVLTALADAADPKSQTRVLVEQIASLSSRLDEVAKPDVPETPAPPSAS